MISYRAARIGNAVGVGAYSPRARADWGQAFLQVAPNYLPVELGRAAAALLCAPFHAGLLHA